MRPSDITRALNSLHVLIDTREQTTERAKKRCEAFGVPYRRTALHTADYSGEWVDENGEVHDMQKICLIERKMSIDELCGNFTRERERFKREFERVPKGCYFAVIIENANIEKINAGRYKSRLKPQALMASITAWSIKYGANFFFIKEESTPKLITEILRQSLRIYLEKDMIF